MSPDQPLDSEQRALLDALPVDGAPIGNSTLRRILRWNAERYFLARNRPADGGLLIIGRGRGGSVRRVVPDTADVRTVSVEVPAGADAAATVEATIRSELALYEPMRQVIANEWATDRRTDSLVVEVTALGGSRPTGLWSRPDTVSIEMRTFAHVPGNTST